MLWRVTEIVDKISSSEYAIDHRLSRLRWKLKLCSLTVALALKLDTAIPSSTLTFPPSQMVSD